MSGAEIVISASALKRNAAEVRRLLGPNRFFYAVVKTEAYGHGIVEVASLLYEFGVRHFAVSSVEEGITLREVAGVVEDAEVLVLGRVEQEEWEAAEKGGLTVTLHDDDDVARFAETVKSGTRIRGHLKVDLGMRRLGVRPEECAKVWARLRDLGAEGRVSGWMTHFDSAGRDLPGTREEWKAFRTVIDRVAGAALSRMTVHCANSAAAVALEETRESAARIGLLLYGYHPKWRSGLHLTPVMTVRGRIIMEKKVKPGEGVSYDHRFIADRAMRLGVVNIGYAHGYPWGVRGAEMGVRGKRAPVVGTVTMDYTMVDITEVPEAGRGDEVEVMGLRVTADELAEKSETIVYDILCNLGRHTRKVIKVEGLRSRESENEGGDERRENVVPGAPRLGVQKGCGETGESEVCG
jgi:alanine racemase